MFSCCAYFILEVFSIRFCFLIFDPQVKAVDNGRPQRWATARLHIEWIRRPPPSAVQLAFEEPLYNFTVMESDKVADIVGVVSAQQQGSTPLWFDITGEDFTGLNDDF